jgi:hypothetical protein
LQEEPAMTDIGKIPANPFQTGGMVRDSHEI